MSAAAKDQVDWASLVTTAGSALYEVPIRRASGEVTTVGATLASAKPSRAIVASWRAVAASDLIDSVSLAAPTATGTPSIVEAAIATAASPWWSASSSRLRRALTPQLDEMAWRAGQIFGATVDRDSEEGTYAARRAMEAVAVVLVRDEINAGERTPLPAIPEWPIAYGAILAVAVDAGTLAWERVESMLFGRRKVFLEEAGFGVSRPTARLLLLAAAEEHLMSATCRCQDSNPDGRQPTVACTQRGHRLANWDPATASLFNWYVTFWRGALRAQTNDDAMNAIADGALRRMILGNLRNPGQWATTSRPARYALRVGEKVGERCDRCGGGLFPPRQLDEAGADPSAPRPQRQHVPPSECNGDTSEVARYHGVGRGLILEPPERVASEAELRTGAYGAMGRDRDRRATSGVVVTVESAPLGFELDHPVWLMKDGTIRPSERPGKRLSQAEKDDLGVARPYAKVWAYLPKGSAYRAFAGDLERVQERLAEQQSGGDIDLGDFAELRIIHKVSRRRGSLIVKRADLADVVTGWLALLDIPEAKARIDERCAADPSGVQPDAVIGRVRQFAAWLGLIDEDEETAP